MNLCMFYWLENAQKSVEAFFPKCIIQELFGILRIVFYYRDWLLFSCYFVCRPIITYKSNSLFRKGIENLRQLNFKKSGGNK
jgi:hypothetical protein